MERSVGILKVCNGIMKRLLYILIFLCVGLQASAAPNPRILVLKAKLAHAITTGAINLYYNSFTSCPPIPLPNYPWYPGSCDDTRGNNDLYAVFDIADSILYRLSGGTYIVNTPGCPPLPNPYYPYDAACNLTIGNNDIYAVWYVLQKIDSLLIVHPPSPVPHGAPHYMAYFLNATQIDSMPWLWIPATASLNIPSGNSLKSLAAAGWLDRNNIAEMVVDTFGIKTRNILMVGSGGAQKPIAMTIGSNLSLTYFPNRSLADTMHQWQIENYDSNLVVRYGKVGYHTIVQEMVQKVDTFAFLQDIRAAMGGAGNLSGTLTPDYIPVADGAHILINSGLSQPTSGIIELAVPAGANDGYTLRDSLTNDLLVFIQNSAGYGRVTVNDNTNTAYAIFNNDASSGDYSGVIGHWTVGALTSSPLSQNLDVTGGMAVITGNSFFGRSTDDGTAARVQIAGNADMGGIIGNSAAPGIAAGSGAGTGPTVSIQGTNISGLITVTTGTGVTLPTGATLVTITYNSLTYPNDSYPVIYPANSATALLNGVTMVYASGTTTTFVITTGTTGLTAVTTYLWNYHVTGN